MKILATQYTLKFQAFEIYTSGCEAPHCSGCHNPEGWDFSSGEDYTREYFQKMKDKIESFDSLIKNVMIFGGEPLDNSYQDLWGFLLDLKSLNKPIWIFTRYELEEIHPDIVDLCDYIKTGRYIESLKTSDNVYFGIELATSNQKIFKIDH